MKQRHREGSVLISAPLEEVFAFVDDHSRFSSHMSESSWRMGGGRMTVELDAGNGQTVGSHIRLSGSVFGVRLSLDEVVSRRDPPTLKVWETVGAPRLLVIGSYRMGVEISSEHPRSRLRVFIDYGLPGGWATYWLGLVLGGFYAKWCVSQMLTGASNHFANTRVAAS